MTDALRGGRRPRVLVLCLDAVGPGMAGIAIRAVESARALAPHVDVTLAAARTTGPPDDLDVPVVTYERHDGRSLRRHLAGVDAVVCQPQWPLVTRELVRSGARLVYDLSGPEALETLDFRAGDQPVRRRLITALTVDRLVEALHTGHHFTAASDRQLDLWLGVMLAERLINPASYDRDRTLRSRLGLVPFGLPDAPPRHTGGPSVRGRFPAIGPGDRVALWNSAIWEWLDADTPIRALAVLRDRRPDVKLVFMAASPRPSGRHAHEAARRLAAELGLLDRSVFFNDGWVPYDERADWLLDADCAIACHELHLETRFSFRTRYLDCFWAGLPVVCTEGDVLADRIEREGLGSTAPERDPEAVAAALERVLDRGRAAHAGALAAAAADLRWSVATRPLVDFVHAPLPARLGEGTVRRPAHRLRNDGYALARTALNRIGLRGPRGLGAG